MTETSARVAFDRDQYDLDRDDTAYGPGVFDEPPYKPLKFLNRRGDQPSSAPTAQPTPPHAGRPDHDAPSGDPLTPLGAVADPT
jgi:hypothetical protein